MTKNLILNEDQIEQKVRRMAFEIFESNFREKKIIIAGIHENGIQLSKMLAKALEEISPLKVILASIDIDKESPGSSDISIDCEEKIMKNKAVILVDDVLNTGKTFAYSMRPFLNIKVKKIEIAVLVDRSHSQFPISSKYTGYELSTTLNDHVEVVLSKNKKAVYLH